MVEVMEPVGRPVRVLIASALGEVVRSSVAARFADPVVARTPEEVTDALRGGLRFDVAVVDLLWHSYALEWQFDGLDVLAAIQEGRHCPVLLAAQGLGVEQDHLEAALAHPLTAGTLLKGRGPSSLLEAIDRLAVGGRHWDDALPGPGLRFTTVGTVLAAHELLAHTCGLVATGVPVSRWADIATHVPYAAKTVENAPKLLAPYLLQRGEIDEDSPVSQAMFFRWCGEHARFIMSWCRRNGLPYRRRRTP